MSGFQKRYDPKLDRTLGDPAKDKIKAKIEKELTENLFLEDNSKDKLGLPDLIVREKVTNKALRYYEPEAKTNWAGGDFPYPTVHVPARKKKYIEAVGAENLTFIIVSKDQNRFLLVPASKLARTIKKVNRFSNGQEEEFLEFNLSDCKVCDF
jgi:hypothetical protein